MQHLGNRRGLIQPTAEERPVTNSVTVTAGDFVKLASGRVTNASIASGKLYGVVLGRNDDLVSRNYRTPTAQGNSGGTVTVLVEQVEGQRYVLLADEDLDAGDVGAYFLLTGTTGAQLVDASTASATTGQLICTKLRPDLGVRYAEYEVANPSTNGITDTTV